MFTNCTDVAWWGEMAAAEACLLCIGVELGMLYMGLPLDRGTLLCVLTFIIF